jgi:stearoyl-CoA desaturase (Delta-9 desaturase)
MDKLESLDLLDANKIAAGYYSKSNNKRITTSLSLGKLMGSKEQYTVDFDDSKDQSLVNGEFDYLKAKHDSFKNEKSNTTKHISEQPFTLSNWHEHINWLNVVLVIVIPLIGVYLAGSGKVKLHKNLFTMSVIYYALGGLGITGGYHRLWSHKSYNAVLPIRIFFALFGAASVEGSVKWWGHSHRLHHRYTDTVRDPYDARRGFWYSHMGWMLLKPNPKFKARADISDLIDDWVVRFQHKHYITIMFIMAFLVPALISKVLWNDFMGGLVYGGILRVFAIQQATFCINSLAHWLGTQPFDDRRTPRDNWITALVTFGEGYHNFHHEFPSDYRNAIKWYQFDPTKVFVYTCSLFGFTYNLKKFPQVIIDQGILQQKQKQINRQMKKMNWGSSFDKLPTWSIADFSEELKKNENLVVINGIVHDITSYISEHPGGESLLLAARGKDVSKAFQGGVYLHSNAAHNLLADYRVAVVQGSEETAKFFAQKRGESAKSFIRN